MTTGTYGHLNVEDMRGGLARLDFSVNGQALVEVAPPPLLKGAAKGAALATATTAEVSTTTARTATPGESLLSVRAVAQKLDLCRASAYRLCEEGKLRFVRMSGAIRVEPTEKFGPLLFRIELSGQLMKFGERGVVRGQDDVGMLVLAFLAKGGLRRPVLAKLLGNGFATTGSEERGSTRLTSWPPTAARSKRPPGAPLCATWMMGMPWRQERG